MLNMQRRSFSVGKSDKLSVLFMCLYTFKKYFIRNQTESVYNYYIKINQNCINGKFTIHGLLISLIKVS